MGEECAVVIEEHREHGLVYEFLNYFTAAFSFSLPLKQHRTLRKPLQSTSMENVAIFDSPGKGRGLKATKEFWAGDVIFSEASVSAVVFDRYG